MPRACTALTGGRAFLAACAFVKRSQGAGGEAPRFGVTAAWRDPLPRTGFALNSALLPEMRERVLMALVLALALVAGWLVFGPFRPGNETSPPVPHAAVER